MCKTLPRQLVNFSFVNYTLHSFRYLDAQQSHTEAYNFGYELVKEYNQFYHDFSILREEDKATKAFRIKLTRNVGKVIKTAMGLLGIEVPERM